MLTARFAIEGFRLRERIEIRNDSIVRIYSTSFSDHINDFKNYITYYRYLFTLKNIVTVFDSFKSQHVQTDHGLVT